MFRYRRGSAAITSEAALGYQQLLQSSLLSRRRRQAVNLRFLTALFGAVLLASIQSPAVGEHRQSAQLLCVAAIAFALILPWLASEADRIFSALRQAQLKGELLVFCMTGVLMTPAMLLTVFALPTSQHWIPILPLAIGTVFASSISDAHPLRVIFLMGPMIIALITGLSWTGESLDLLLALAITGIAFASVIWLRQRHASLMTSLVARVNEQMIPVRLERQVAAQKQQIEAITLSHKTDWQDMLHAARGIVSLSSQLVSASPPQTGIARALSRSSKHLSEQILYHSELTDLVAGAHQSESAWIKVASLFEAVRFRLIAQTQASGARLQFMPVSADVEATPFTVERIVQNLVLHCLNDANASSVTVSAKFRPQALTLCIDHDGRHTSPELLTPNLAREGLPRALALATAASQDLRIEANKTTGFSLPFEQWRKHQAPMIREPRTLSPMAEPYFTAKCRTLLIDDDPLARVGLAALLENAGYDTIIWNGQSTDSIESSLADAEISFIVSDWWLSKNANAIAMLEWVQTSLPAPVPVVIVSGDKACLDGPSISAQLNNIPVRTLSKPVTPKTLARAISDLIEIDKTSAD